MKIGGRLFAILAVGALSTNAAVASHHHGHHGSGGNAAGAGTPNQAKSPAAIGGQQGSVPATESAPDHVNAAKTGVSPDTGTSVNAHGRFHPALPGGAAPESGPGAEIDTRITVHQGRNAPKNTPRTLKATIAPGKVIVPGTVIVPTNAMAPATNPGHHHVHDQHQKPAGGASGVPQRNAIGAVVDKTVKLGNTSATGAAAPTTSMAAPAANVAPPPTAGAIAHDPKLPVKPPAGATQIGNHASGTTLLAIATTSGPNINGTGMIRPGSSTSAVGGAAKILAGVISGNSFRPKHP